AFFVLLSLGSVLFILGWPDGAWVLGLGGALVVLCHVPLSWGVRALALASAGVGLAVFRMGSTAPFWPVLGSMFMFRLAVFLHDTRHAPARPPLLVTLAYFLPLPNICFTFFPVI